MITKVQSGSYQGLDYDVFNMTAKSGFQVTVTNVGCTIMKIMVPDRNGKLADVALGFDTVEEYIDDIRGRHFGAIIGRVANRVKDSKFTLQGKEISVTPNRPDGGSLHGGWVGFDMKAFASAIGSYNGHEALFFYYTSPDGEEGYPGNLNLRTVYYITDDGELFINYTATTDQTTACNITNHSYFNLKGHDCAQTIEDHIVTIKSDFYTKEMEGLYSTGEIVSIKGTPFDFNQEHTVSERINEEHDDLKLAGGYDLNYVLHVDVPGEVQEVAKVYEPTSGRTLKVFTNCCGIQLYTGNNITPGSGKNGAHYDKRSGLCLETQNFPGSVHFSHFPSSTLEPGKVFDYTTIYQFSAQ